MRLALLVILAAGCAKPTTYGDLLHQAHQLTCDAQARCGCATDTTAACVRSLDAQTAQAAQNAADMIANGEATFDANVAANCLDGLRGAWADCTSPSTAGRNNLKICASTLAVLGASAAVDSDQPDGDVCFASWTCHNGYCSPTNGGTCATGTVQDVVCTGPPPL
jgi:hypothetical protein